VPSALWLPGQIPASGKLPIPFFLLLQASLWSGPAATLLLSGTDRGGVLWFRPTGRHATFSAHFEDRFRAGESVQHDGKTDTEGLLRQLGHT
jgi:hypothetical protein